MLSFLSLFLYSNENTFILRWDPIDILRSLKDYFSSMNVMVTITLPAKTVRFENLDIRRKLIFITIFVTLKIY